VAEPDPRPSQAVPNEVLAVRHGTLETTRAHQYLNYDVYGEADAPMRLDYYFWIIRSEAGIVLVDTGFSAEAARRRGREVLVDVPDALRTLGIDADTPVDLVLTHAHYDHAGNLDAVPNARVFVARAELEFWTSPTAQTVNFQSVMEDADLAALATARAEGRVTLVDGVHDLAPGVRLIPMPGHTPGQLIVTVATSRGTIVLASDAVHFEEELERDMPFRHTTDLVGLHEGFALLRRWRAEGSVIDVISGHDPATMRRFPPLPGPLAAHAVIVAG